MRPTSATSENAAGQVARLAIFNFLNPTATAKWLDVSGPGDASNGIAIGGTFAASPMLHAVGDNTIRIFFAARQAGDTVPIYRVLYKDYTISTAKFSELHQVRCTIAKTPGEILDLTLPTVQRHVDFLVGSGLGEHRKQNGGATDGTATSVDSVEPKSHRPGRLMGFLKYG